MSRRVRLDPVLAVCFLVLLGFPFAATLAADGQPVPPVADRATAAPAQGPPVRTVPALTPGGAVAAVVGEGAVLEDERAMGAALAAAMEELFDRRDRAALLRFARGETAFDAEPVYPFRYRNVEPALDRALGRSPDDGRTAIANDLGALLTLAAARFQRSGFPNAARLGFAVLDRARAGGACLPQLNLAFLLSTDVNLLSDHVRAEYRRADEACPEDPTPLWLLGQFVSQEMLLADAQSAVDASAEAVAASRRLQRRFPGSPAGWTGEADAELRLAYLRDHSQPFSARAHFRRALALYERAGTDPTVAPGTARAYAGLRRYGDAVAAQRRAVDAVGASAPLDARLVEYLERDRRYGEAAAAAERLAASPRFPAGAALYMTLPGTVAVVEETLHAEDALEPLSLGVERLTSVAELEIAPTGVAGGGGAAAVDLSFLPEFRPVAGVTGYDRWCPAWAQRRDLVLSGRAPEALEGMPRRFEDIRPSRRGVKCETGALLAAVAQLEAGDAERASARLHDARQNLLRFAGQLDRAGAATDQWMRAQPDSVTAADRAGEVAFLAGDYDLAAELLGRAVRREWSASGSLSVVEAEARLKRGTALARGGRLDEARTELQASDEIASRLVGQDALDPNAAPRARYVSYHARLQAGDAELRARRYAAAAEHYQAALERQRELGLTGAPERRPEVLDNNRALVQAQLGHGAAALSAARQAVAVDPGNPLFRLTEGFALQRLGRWREAAATYRLATAAEPTLAPAWNDLGVALARAGRDADAADAFRHAVAVQPGYARGWFNLGVALESTGPSGALAAEGALGRAFRADPDLRGRARSYLSDDAPYITTLDLSKPLPPTWELEDTRERTPVAAAGLALALLLALRLGRTLATQGLAGGAAKSWLQLGRDLVARLPALLRYTTAAVAVVATLALFAWPLARSDGVSATSVALQLTGVGVLIVIVLRGRALAARRAGVALRQRGWWPAIGVGAGATAAGLSWAPLPVAETGRPAAAVHWIGPVLIGFAALALLVLGAWLQVPLTTSLGAAALVMAASMLVPLEPLDGGHIASGTAGLAANLALLGGALFVLLGLA